MTARNLLPLRTIPGPRALLLALGVVVLGSGACVYAIRATDPSATLAGIAPSFIHVLAMVLLAAALSTPTRRGSLALCMSWVSINGFFEIAQRPEFARPIYHWLQGTCGSWSPCHRSAVFFREGTFDPLDLAAAAAGGVCAWLLLRQSAKHSGSRA